MNLQEPLIMDKKWFIIVMSSFLENWRVLERKHGALRPEKPSRLIRDREVGGSGISISNTYLLQSPPEWLCIKVGSCVSHFNVSLAVWAKSQDSVHKPQFLKRKESRSGSNRGPSAYQPSALLLGHTGSQIVLGHVIVMIQKQFQWCPERYKAVATFWHSMLFYWLTWKMYVMISVRPSKKCPYVAKTLTLPFSWTL